MDAPRKHGAFSGRSLVARGLLFFFPLLISVPLLQGCRSTEALEADNRKKETENRELRERLEHVESVNNGLMHDLYGAVPPPAAPSSAAKPAEQPVPVYGLKEIVIGRGTGGVDEDHVPGDEALRVVVEPRDSDNHAVKVSGTLQITALEVRPEGLKVPISSWEVPPDKLRRLWTTGFMSTGYTVVLPWQKPPATSKVRVVVRFLLPDSRVFEADKDVTVRPPKGPAPHPPVEEHNGESPLPMPRQADGPPLSPAGAWNPPAGRAATLMAPVPRE
jgi:hypothetical protein